MIRRLVSIIFMLVWFSGSTQMTPTSTLRMEEKDSIYHLPASSVYINPLGKGSFDEFRDLSLEPVVKKRKKVHRDIWYKFFIRPMIKADTLAFMAALTDISELFVPFKDHYEKFKGGRLSQKKIRYDILESSAEFIPTDRIDFSRPFYLHLKNIMAVEGISLTRPGSVILSDRHLALHYHILKNGVTRKFQVYLGIISLAFLLFFISFLITRDRNFLNYSLYLLGIPVVFVHQIPFLHNLLGEIYPYLPGMVSRLGIILTSLTYFYFAVRILETEKYAPELRTLVKFVINMTLVYAGIKIFQMTLRPNFTGQFSLYLLFNMLFMGLSLLTFTIMWFKPIPRIKKIIILGSYLLIAGHLISIVWKNDFYFLNTVFAEIALFFTVVLLRHKQIYEERVRYKFNLEVAQHQRENLQILDEMKSRFFSHISHEFRTPLTLINASLNQIEKEISTSGNLKKHIKRIRHHSERLLELVNQLLDISKLQSHALKPQISQGNLKQLIAMLCDSFSDVAKEKKINYLIHLNFDEEFAWFDKDFVHKILDNLLSNAFKYTPEGGTVICNVEMHDNKFIFEIKNTGEGLTQEELPHIFDRFYQKDETAEGAGLGLSLVKELINKHLGEIHVDSTPGEWTVFSVILPTDQQTYMDAGLLTQEQISDTVEPGLTTHKSLTTLHGEKPVLLVIEDHPEVREYIVEIFQNKYNVLQASEGKEGIRLAIESVPDLIISDIMMPGINGFEVCEKLKNDIRTAHIPFILLTAKADKKDIRKGTRCGAVDYITKPFDEEELLFKVENLLHTLLLYKKRSYREALLVSKNTDLTGIDEKFLEHVEKILQARLTEPSFSVENFARAVNMSRMQLHRKLKALTGLSATEYIRLQRLRLAARLLSKPGVNINEVAYTVGFNSPSYFIRRFKETYGVTPKEFAEKHSKIS